jgi:lipid-A-disaccharide synthase
MPSPLRLFITAGEPSGDRIGADLLKRLRSRTVVAPGGVGGDELAGEGLVSLFPMSDLSVMGITDVLARLPLLLWRIRQTSQAILRHKPDVVVLIDSQEFSARVARQVRKAGYRGPILLYVAPSVWAWKPERAKGLNGVFDEILAVLPFEPKALRDLEGPQTFYVGHPALERTFFRDVVPNRGPLLLLPGSRSGELRRHLPMMQRVAAEYSGHARVSHLVLPTPLGRLAEVRAAVDRWDTPVSIITDDADRADAFASAVAAVAVSGTITLELALAGIPMVVPYVADRGQYSRWVSVGSPQVALPNILLRQRLVPELMSRTAPTDDVIRELDLLLDQTGAADAQAFGFRIIREMMEKNIADPAERVLARALGQRLPIAT